jgi:hypothetical protein
MRRVSDFLTLVGQVKFEIPSDQPILVQPCRFRGGGGQEEESLHTLQYHAEGSVRDTEETTCADRGQK